MCFRCSTYRRGDGVYPFEHASPVRFQINATRRLIYGLGGLVAVTNRVANPSAPYQRRQSGRLSTMFSIPRNKAKRQLERGRRSKSTELGRDLKGGPMRSAGRTPFKP